MEELYIVLDVDELIKKQKDIIKTVSVKDGGTAYNRIVTDIDTVKIEVVPSELMKTVYDFYRGMANRNRGKTSKYVLSSSVSCYNTNIL